MASAERAFLSKVVLEIQTKAAVQAGITPAFFRDEDYRRMYEFILDHWSRYGTPVDDEVMLTAFPNEQWVPQPQALDYLIDQMRNDRIQVILNQSLTEAAKATVANDGQAMLQVVTDGLIQARLETSNSLNLDITAMTDEIMAEYWERRDNPGVLRGISTGVDGIDFVTGGLQPEQFVVMLGLPKSFKSATLLHMARCVHQDANVPLFVGFEMAMREQRDRLTSLLSGVSLTRILNGTTTVEDMDKIDTAMTRLEARRPFVFSTDITAASTVTGVQAMIQEYQPNAVFIDGAYLMHSEKSGVEQGSPQAITDISRSLKRLAQQQQIPIVVTTQASLRRSKGGLSLDSAMYSQAWGQDCDVLLGVERVKEDKDERSVDDDTGPAKIKFRVLESRSGPRKDCLMEWDWNNGHVEEIKVEAIRAMLAHGVRGYGEDDEDVA